MKIMNKIYEFAVFIQIFLFIIFLIENFDNLSSIPFEIPEIGPIDARIIDINFFGLIAVLALIIGIVILAGINVFGSGISEFGTSMFSRFMFLITFFSILSIGSLYYILPMGYIGLLLEFLFLMIWILKGVNMLNTEESEE